MKKDKCTPCNGLGLVPCEGCRGSGKKTPDKVSERTWSSCASCHGRGTITCRRCGGSGKV